MSRGDVVIVGAAAAGITVAEVLRRKGFDGRLRLVGEEVHQPYDRPPLSKQILTGEWEPRRARLRDERQLAGLDAEWLLGRAEHLDVETRRLRLDDGRALSFGSLVIATGVVPRRLDCQPRLPGVYTFRTLDDAITVRRELGVDVAAHGGDVPPSGRTDPRPARAGSAPTRRVVIVGAGVLGCEIAASARVLGHTVTLVELGAVPMLRQLGHRIGGLVAALHRDRGVRLRTDVGVTGFGGRDRLATVTLTDGTVLAADLAVVAAGSVPATGWLTGSGLDLADGIGCDEYGRAAPGVWAVGDVARWRHRATGTATRIETRANAAEQAVTVAADILGTDRPLSSIPYFWSDQYDTRIQLYGTVPPEATIRVIDGEVDHGRFVALARTSSAVTAAIGWNHPRGARAARVHITG